MLPRKKLASSDLIKMIRRRIWLIVIPPVFGLFGALLYSSKVPNLYQADMLIAVDPQRVPDSFVRSTVTLQTDRRMDAITVQVLSRTNLERMIQEFDLYPTERLERPMDDVVVLMRAAIAVNLEFPRPRWGAPLEPTAFHVKFTYTDPEVAAAVTQRLGTLFVEQNERDRGALAAATNQFLESQLEEARRKLVDQERRLEAFRQRHGPELPTQLQTNMNAIQNKQMQVQSLVESIARDRDRKLLLERLYREAAAEPAIAATTPTAPANQPSAAAVGTAQQQLIAARNALTALEARYTANHPDVVRARRTVAELEPKAASEAAAAASAAGNADASSALQTVTDPTRRETLRQMAAEIESLDRQTAFKETEERRVRAEIAEYQRRVEAVPGLESEFAALTRDYETQQTAYKELLTKSTAAQVAADLEKQDIGERFRIVDEAKVPVNPLMSVRIRYNGSGLALGLIFGLGLAALLELRDASFRTEADVLEVLGLPVLAAVPHVETALEGQRRRRRMLVLSTVGAVCLTGMGYVTWVLKLWKSLV